MKRARFQQIAELFEKSRELDGKERRDFLHGRCGQDEALRREVEALLEAHDASGNGGFLDGETRHVVATPGTTPAPAAGAAEGRRTFPDRIGKYQVLDRLGEGGQATVYRAYHPALGREVVVKLLKHSLGREARERLVEEGRILSQLDEPGLVRVHDLDFDGDRPFLVMEPIAGRNLFDATRERRYTPREAAEIVESVARALSSAHRRGIIHRDIKPSNIVLDEGGTPHLIDFGIASAASPWSEGGASSDLSGTVEFMAPEQASGERPVGVRSDVFSLGAVLFFLLTGEAPIRGSTFQEKRERAIRGEIDREPLRRSSAPRRLKAICQRALSVDPDERYATAEELADRLRRSRAAPARRVFWATVGVLALAVAMIGTALIPPPLQVEEASFWRVREHQPPEALSSQVVLSLDSEVFLRFRANRDVYLYVLNEDERGHRELIFPDLTGAPEPSRVHHLTGEVSHRLPDGGKIWPVKSPGGTEHIFLLASLEPIPFLDDYARGDSSRLDLRDFGGVVRGLGRPQTPSGARPRDSALLAGFIDELDSARADADTAPGVWIRKVSFRNP